MSRAAIQFLGLDFSEGEVRAAVLSRQLTVTARKATKILNARRDEERGAVEVPAAEWLRAAGYVLQEIYLDLPVALRRIWGIGLASPPGWIALDFDLEPLGDLRLLPDEGIAADIRRWRTENPRLARRVACILSPKDYYRFAISGALAADVTAASRQGLLIEGQSRWDEDRLAAEDLDSGWLPPVFDCDVRTGRISEQGMRQTGLPGGLWLVAGGLSSSCSRIASGDLRRGKLWIAPRARRIVFGASTDPAAVPDGFSRHPSVYTGGLDLEWRVDPEGEAEGDPGLDRAGEEAARRLERAGLEVEAIVRNEGPGELGAAALAAIGSGLVSGWDDLYARWEPV